MPTVVTELRPTGSSKPVQRAMDPCGVRHRRSRWQSLESRCGDLFQLPTDRRPKLEQSTGARGIVRHDGQRPGYDRDRNATSVGCIQEIRKALGDHAKTPRFIKTAPRLGYQFVLWLVSYDEAEEKTRRRHCPRISRRRRETGRGSWPRLYWPPRWPLASGTSRRPGGRAQNHCHAPKSPGGSSTKAKA